MQEIAFRWPNHHSASISGQYIHIYIHKYNTGTYIYICIWIDIHIHANMSKSACRHRCRCTCTCICDMHEGPHVRGEASKRAIQDGLTRLPYSVFSRASIENCKSKLFARTSSWRFNTRHSKTDCLDDSAQRISQPRLWESWRGCSPPPRGRVPGSSRDPAHSS